MNFPHKVKQNVNQVKPNVNQQSTPPGKPLTPQQRRLAWEVKASIKASVSNQNATKDQLKAYIDAKHNSTEGKLDEIIALINYLRA